MLCSVNPTSNPLSSVKLLSICHILYRGLQLFRLIGVLQPCAVDSVMGKTMRPPPNERSSFGVALGLKSLPLHGFRSWAESDVFLRFSQFIFSIVLATTDDALEDSPLIEFEEVGCYNVALPSRISISTVSKLIKCNQSKAVRHSSDAVFFWHVSKQFNHEVSLSLKIPSGLFNAMFDFSGCWQEDSVNSKTLAFDGMFITLYTVSLENSQMALHDHVKKAVPSSWETCCLCKVKLDYRYVSMPSI